MTAEIAITQERMDLLNVWKTGSKPVVIWAGAGLSAPSNLPSWPKLRENLQQALRESIENSGQSVAAHRRTLLEASVKQESPWMAFELLEEAFGRESFNGAVTRELFSALKCAIPHAYTLLWNLKVKGFLTLNIDRLAYRSFQESDVKKDLLNEKNGFEIRSLLGILTHADARFIANLHGQLEDPINWVFTEKKLQGLLKQKEYNEFLRDCIKYCTVVLIGITATDIAVISHFQKARKDLLNFGPHFWISDTDNFEAITKAEDAGIRVITYKNTDGKHSELAELLRLVKQFVPHADTAEPVVWDLESAPIGNAIIGAPKELLTRSPNDLRKLLNEEARKILQPGVAAETNEFNDFCKKYARPILLATNFDPEEDDANEVLGYRLTSFEKEGGFGKVWRGIDQEGAEVAVKAFKYEIRERPQLLDAFRRGVRSMRYLEQRGVSGVVKFLAASEVPPVVIMEWVNGVTLHEAALRGGMKSWRSRIWTLSKLAEIVYSAHTSPERVLHRDIRPQNIMLRDYESGEESPDVVVLDFDLSWHVGALEKSVYVAGGTAYLAPEQLSEQEGATTRSAAVDSFGFGMTAYFIATRSDPLINAHQRADWAEQIAQIARQSPCREWRSAPRRLCRLIEHSTRHQQASRLSFSEIVAELALLRRCLSEDETIADTRVVAEEVFARSGPLADYEFSDGWPLSQRPSGLTVSAHQLAAGDAFEIRISFLQRGHESYQKLYSVGEFFKVMSTKFSSSYLTSHRHRVSNGDFFVALNIDISDPRTILSKLPKELNAVIDAVTTKLA